MNTQYALFSDETHLLTYGPFTHDRVPNPGEHKIEVTEPYEAGLFTRPPGKTISDAGGTLAVVDAPITVFPPIKNVQLRLKLIQLGIIPKQVDALIDAMPDEAARETARSEWHYRETFHRDHPLVAQLGTALGLTPAQIDTAFAEAAAL